MVRIGFIVQSSKYNYKPFRNQPLVALYLLTILERHFGDMINVSLIDLRGVEEENLLYHIPEKDVFLYSFASIDFHEISGIIRGLRGVYPEAKHVAGGPHVNIFPEENSRLFDAIVLGEGEESIVSVVRDIIAASLKPRYRQLKPVDLNAYPYPSRKYIPATAVGEAGILVGRNAHLKGTAVIFSRGCPFNCHFCANKKLTFGPLRYRAPELVTEEIEYLKRDYGIEALALKDDNAIPPDPRIARPFLEAIGRTGVKWRGQTRVHGAPPEIIQLAKDAGCVDIAIGLESASPAVLKIINKQIDLEKAKTYIQLLNKTGIGVRLNCILGLPGESPDIVKQMLHFFEETNPTSVILSLFVPMPGSEIYEHPERFGIKLDTIDWRRYNTLFARFDADERPATVFEYDKKAPWGTTMSRDRIVDNYLELQSILRSKGLNF